jgi:hypothetical protein
MPTSACTLLALKEQCVYEGADLRLQRDLHACSNTAVHETRTSNRTVDLIQSRTESILDRSAADVALRCCARKGLRRDDDDEMRVDNALVHVSARVEVARALEDLCFDARFVPSDRWLNEESRRRSAVAHNDAVFNEISAKSPDVVFNGPLESMSGPATLGYWEEELTWCRSASCSPI